MKASLEQFQTQQMRRARFDVIEPVFVLPVVAQNFLKQLVQLAEVVIRRRPLDRRHKRTAPFGRQRCRCPGKPCRITEDITRMVAIRLFRCAIVGAVGQWFKRGRGFAHKA